MSEQAQVAAGVVAFAVLLFFGGIVFWLKRAHEVGRLRRFVAAHTQGADPTSAMKRVADTSAFAVGLNQKISQSNMAKRLDLQLVRAGLSITANQFILIQVALAAMLFLVGRYVLFAEQGSLALLISIVLAVPAVILPRLVLKFLQARRINRFETQLAQTVDIMAGALQAGTSLPQSFTLVHREMPLPISEEFGRLIQECTLGIPLDQA